MSCTWILPIFHIMLWAQWSEGNTKGHGWGTLSASAIQLLGAWPTRSRLEQPLGCRSIQQRYLSGFFSVILCFPEPDSNKICILSCLHTLLLSPPVDTAAPRVGDQQGSVPPGPPSCPSPHCLLWPQSQFSTLTASKWQDERAESGKGGRQDWEGIWDR